VVSLNTGRRSRFDSLIGNASAALFGRLASAGGQFACLLFIGGRLGGHVLDRYVLMFTLVGLAATVVDFGSGTWAMREVAADRPLRFAWRIRVCAFLLIVVVALLMIRSGHLSEREAAFGLAWMALSASTLLARGALWGLRSHHIEAYAGALETCGLAAALALLPTHIIEPVGPVGLAVLAYASGLALRIVFLLRQRLQTSPAAVSIATLAPYGLQSFVTFAGMRLDVVLLYSMGAGIEPGALGGYAVALRAYAAAPMPVEAVSAALLPRMVRSVEPYISQIRRLWLGGAAIATAAVYAFMWLLPRIETSAAIGTAAGSVLRVLIFSIGLRCGAYLLGAIVTAQGRQAERLLASAASLVTMVVLDLLLIPHHGAVGAAWAFAVSDVVLVALYAASAARIIRAARIDA
jgi:O-antigen/teichoic acid export membrane protein